MSARDINLSILASAEIFSGLPRESLEEVVKLSFRRRFDAGEVVFRQCDPASNIFVVVMGQLRVAQATAEGQQVIAGDRGRRRVNVQDAHQVMHSPWYAHGAAIPQSGESRNGSGQG